MNLPHFKIASENSQNEAAAAAAVVHFPIFVIWHGMILVGSFAVLSDNAIQCNPKAMDLERYNSLQACTSLK